MRSIHFCLLWNVELVDDNFSNSLHIIFELNVKLDFFFTAKKIIDPISFNFSDFILYTFLSFPRNSGHWLVQVGSLFLISFNKIVDFSSLGSLVKNWSWFIGILLLLLRRLISWLLLGILTIILLNILAVILLRVLIASLLRELVVNLVIIGLIVVYIVEGRDVRVWKEIIDILLLAQLLL